MGYLNVAIDVVGRVTFLISCKSSRGFTLVLKFNGMKLLAVK
jgi:hypothetical protein